MQGARREHIPAASSASRYLPLGFETIGRGVVCGPCLPLATGNRVSLPRWEKGGTSFGTTLHLPPLSHRQTGTML